MDFFSHIFWTWAAFKILKEKIRKPLNLKLAIFWGVFPDLFAFVPPLSLIALNLFLGKSSLSDFPRPETMEPPQQDSIPIFHLLSLLYSISHSFVIFLIVFALILGFAFLIHPFRSAAKEFRIPWEMGGWLLHILIDIPTHSTQFYSTPFFWPISNIRFNGISWGTPWFLALNYLVIFIVYFTFLRKKKTNT